MNNIYVLNKSYGKIGTLSNQGANPQAPYYDDLYTQELDTGADTYQFSTTSSTYTQDLLEIGNHIMFAYKNRNELFTITSLEYSHYEGYKTIGVYAEGIGFDLLEVFMEKPSIQKNPGNDSDGDDDDDYDDEYGDPDDVWIDENGNIVYIKNRNENGDDYGSPDDVWIDEDGNICYKKNRNNRDNDSLEFKNISYSTFLNVLLKDTGWSYVCQPGLESEKHDISIRYDTNIYAILQDSIQAYEGIELEFVHEMNGNSVQKIIKAYKNGGRGSFVGKRFEYGTNVKGITKTQKVTDSEDDTVIHIGNIGVDVTYDIDFALKSAEVPEIEIGDTHYVIDNSFYPSMNIEARIGKIEVSFSDPTKNKIYVANFKKIAGSTPDNLDGDNVEDIIDDKLDDYLGDSLDDVIDDKIDDKIGEGIDDYLDNKIGEGIDDKIDEYLDDKIGEGIDDKIDEYLDSKIGEGIDDYIDNYLDDKIGEGLDGYLGEHTHDKLVSENDGSKTPLVFKSGHGFTADNNNKWHMTHLVTSDIGLNFGVTDAPGHWTSVYIERSSSLANGAKATATIFTSDGNMVPDTNKQYIGSPEYRWAGIYSDYINSNSIDSDYIYAANSVNSPRYYGYNYQVRFDRDDMRNVTKVTDKQDLLDFIINDVNVYKYSSKTIDDVVGAPDKMPYQEYYGLLAEDFTTHNSSTDCGGSEVAYNIIKALVTDDTNNDGEQNQNDGHNKHTYNLPALVTALIGAFQQHVENGVEDGGENGGGDHSKCAEKKWVEEWCSNLELADNEMYERIEVLEADYATKKYVDDAIDVIEVATYTGIKRIYISSSNHLVFILYDNTMIDAGMLPSITDFSKYFSYDSTGYNSLVCHESLVVPRLIIDDGDESGRLSIMGNNSRAELRNIEGVDSITFSDGSKMSTAGESGGSYSSLDKYIKYVSGDSMDYTNPPQSHLEFKLGIKMDYNGFLYIQNGTTYILLNQGWVFADGVSAKTIKGEIYSTSDESLKENIRYLDSETTPDVGEGEQPDFLVKADLHDFIVNQVNLCEYNFIDDDSPKIGFIANEYEGTKVGDKIVSSHELKEHDENGETTGTTETLMYDLNNLVFATIGALQEEVRIKDEKIASLEARLAKIEEMLGINN